MSDEFKHWGIKDQKWGQRRYQTLDGRYTEEGKARRRKEYSYNPEPEENWSEDGQRFEKMKNRDPRALSTKELREYVDRKRAIDDYNKLFKLPTRAEEIEKFIAPGKELINTAVQVFNSVGQVSKLINDVRDKASAPAKKKQEEELKIAALTKAMGMNLEDLQEENKFMAAVNQYVKNVTK